MTSETKDLNQALFRDGFNYFLGKVIPGLMGFLSVLVFIRLLGAEQYGRYAVVFAFVMAWASGLGGWLSQGILRFQSQWREPQQSSRFFRSVLLGTALSVVAGFVLLSLAMPVFGIELGWSLLIPLGLVGVLIAYIVATAHFQASLRSARILWLEATRSVLCFIIPALFLMIAGIRSYRLLLLGIGFGYALPLVYRFCSSLRKKSFADVFAKPSAEQRVILAEIWRFGWPVALWLLCQQGLLVSDRYFLQRHSGYSDAGVYASMYDVIVRSLSLVFMPVTLAIHPLVMNLWNTGRRADALRAIRSGIFYQIMMFLPVGTCLIFLGSWLSRFILGKVDVSATSIVLPLAIGGFLWQVCLLSHKPLEILCQTRRMLFGILVALAINVFGNWLFVPRYGFRASAYLTVVSSFAYLLMLLLLTPVKDIRDEATAASANTAYSNKRSEGVLSRAVSS